MEVKPIFSQKNLNKSYPKLRKNSKYHHLSNTRYQNLQTHAKKKNFGNKNIRSRNYS